MLPFAFNTLRQAALNYQMNSGGSGGPGPVSQSPTMVGVQQQQTASPYMLPYPSLDNLLAYRGFGCPPRFIHEEPKPQHSYIGLIAMAILSVPDKKMVLSDIYQWILDNYAYFRTRGPGWRNSIRHNLSLNDCFIKSGRSANGKGHYWAIHPANLDDFRRGDFRRRRAQKKVRKYNGLSVPDDDDDSDESPAPSPHVIPFPSAPGIPKGDGLSASGLLPASLLAPSLNDSHSSSSDQFSPKSSGSAGSGEHSAKDDDKETTVPLKKRKLFDMASILAPHKEETLPEKRAKLDDASVLQAQLLNSMMFNNPNNRNPYALHPSAQFWSAALSGFGVGGATGAGQMLLSPWSLLQQAQLQQMPAAAATVSNPPSPPAVNSQQQWQETFAKIMARSYRPAGGNPPHQPLAAAQPTDPEHDSKYNEQQRQFLTSSPHSHSQTSNTALVKVETD